MASHPGVVVTESGPDEPEERGSGPTQAPRAAGPSGLEACGSGPPAGDRSPASFAELYLQSFAAMVQLARVLVDSPEIAEDLVQDAFVHLHRHWGGVRDPRPYLHRSVVNAGRSHHRRAWRERSRAPRPDVVAGRTEASGPGDLEGLVVVDGAAEQRRSDDADVLGAALATLPYRQRAALVLRYYSDLPDADIAVALGCRPGTVASLVHRGLERLREVVEHDR
ncbi:MAG TPA: sigma-70 family RNA polymerase sigma factor [Acidimicrobiales bacterium]